MKKQRLITRLLPPVLLVLCAGVLFSGCTSYLVNRGRDAADIITIGAGLGWGAKARVSSLQAGLLFEATKGGLRGGELVSSDSNAGAVEETDAAWGHSMDIQGVLFGGEYFMGCELPRNKNFFAGTETDSSLSAIPFIHRLDSGYTNPAYYMQVEAVAALGISLRLGVNPGELIDFVLGFTTIDVFGDDVGLEEEGFEEVWE